MNLRVVAIGSVSNENYRAISIVLLGFANAGLQVILATPVDDDNGDAFCFVGRLGYGGSPLCLSASPRSPCHHRFYPAG